MLNPRLNLLVDYPFQRLTALLSEPGGAPAGNVAALTRELLDRLAVLSVAA